MNKRIIGAVTYNIVGSTLFKNYVKKSYIQYVLDLVIEVE